MSEVVKEEQPIKGRNLFKKFGPICTSEGFYQHRGECWSDAIQMGMLYTDSIKEFTQPKLAFEDIEYKDIEVRFDKTVDNTLREFDLVSNNSNKLKTKNLQAIFLYFKAVQERFRRHYMAEIERFQKIGPIQCYSFEKMGQESLDFLINLGKTYRSGVPTVEKPGFQSAIMSMKKKEFVEANREELAKELPLTGGSTKNIEYVIHLYNKYFNLNLGRKHQNLKDPLSYSANCHFLFSNYLKTNIQHLTCFLQCGGKEYYYDDNEGIYPFPYRKLLKEYKNLQTTVNEQNVLKIFLLSDLSILDKNTKQGITMFKHYPFLSLTTKDTTKYITFIDNTDEPLEIIKSNTNTSIVIKQIEVENLIYNFVIKQNDDIYEIFKILSVVNKVKNENRPKYNIGSGFNEQTGKYLGSRLKKYESPFQKAMLAKDKDTIMKLIESHIGNINERDINGDTVLHVAIELNDLPFVEYLLSQPGIQLNIKDADEQTPLQKAISTAYFDIALLLSKAGADPTIENDDGLAPIHKLIGLINVYTSHQKYTNLQERLNSVYLLLDDFSKKYNIIPYFKKYLYRTIFIENKVLLKFFLDHGLNINEPYNNDGEFILNIPIQVDNLEMFLFLLENGADPTIENKDGKTTKEIIEEKFKKYPTEKQIWLNALGTSNKKNKEGGFSKTRKNSRTNRTKKRKNQKTRKL